jgi:hypothetical protein
LERSGGVHTLVFVGGILLGLCLAYARGVRLRDLERAELRATWVLILAALVEGATQRLALAGRIDPFTTGRTLELFTLLLLAYGLWQNRQYKGAWVLGLGFLLNSIAILAYGGQMPVTEEALKSAGLERAVSLLKERGDGLHVLAQPGNPVNVLGDTLPLALTHQILSLGDLLIIAGTAWLVVELGLAARRKMGAVR